MKKYTIEEIRDAFWHDFHKAGELWFDYLGSDDENNDCTVVYWEEFKGFLEDTASQK